MHQVLLYYYYGHLDDAEALAVRERERCQELGLTGRVIVAEEGINATLEGTTEATEEYVARLYAEPRFANIHMKRSKGTGHAFKKLSVKYRKEIVSAHLDDADFNPADFTAPHLSPEELHAWINSDKRFFIVDMRNDYEHSSGHFAGSILPKFKNFRDLKEILPSLDHLKNEVVVTVCTGGVRCEKAAGFLLRNGFNEVYQLDGGIVSYMEKYPNQDFLGKLYVFDNRILMGFNTEDPAHTIVGRCEKCGAPSENYVNEDRGEYRHHFICCEACFAKSAV